MKSVSQRRSGRCRFFRLLLVVIAGQVVFCVVVLHISNGRDKSFIVREKGKRAIQYFQDRQLKHSDQKLILLWTPMWGTKHWWEYDKLGIPDCGRRCNVTTDKNRISEADAVLFHWGNMWWNTPLPGYLRPHQVWVLVNYEPPHKQSNLASWASVFNWTMTYRKDSTVYTPFGEYFTLNDEELVFAKKMYADRNFQKERKRNISLTISNCYDAAARYRLAHEINKYIHVDMYGNCEGNHACIFNSGVCNSKLKSYKFHLALENSYCRDYFSEKFWEALDDYVVPIVAWRQDPGSMVPHHSYINVFDFPDVGSLAAYLKEMLSNDTLYNSYFDWRLSYKSRQNYNRHWCPLCDALFDSAIPAQVIKDPYAWINNDYCAESLIFTWLKILLNRLLFNLGL